MGEGGGGGGEGQNGDKQNKNKSIHFLTEKKIVGGGGALGQKQNLGR